MPPRLLPVPRGPDAAIPLRTQPQFSVLAALKKTWVYWKFIVGDSGNLRAVGVSSSLFLGNSEEPPQALAGLGCRTGGLCVPQTHQGQGTVCAEGSEETAGFAREFRKTGLGKGHVCDGAAESSLVLVK